MRPFSTEVATRHPPPAPRQTRLAIPLRPDPGDRRRRDRRSPGSPRALAVDDNWAGPDDQPDAVGAIPGSGARAARGRGTADSDDDGARPQRRHALEAQDARRGIGAAARWRAWVAISRPRTCGPLSVIEWARPKFEAVSCPKSRPRRRRRSGRWSRASAAISSRRLPPAAPGLTARADPLAAEGLHRLPRRAPARRPGRAGRRLRPDHGQVDLPRQAAQRPVGGAKRSYHLTGNAVDFNMTGNYRAILAFLKGSKLVGGLKHYGRGAFHIDTGPRRTW